MDIDEEIRQTKEAIRLWQAIADKCFADGNMEKYRYYAKMAGEYRKDLFEIQRRL